MNINRCRLFPTPSIAYIAGAYIGDGSIRTEKRIHGVIHRLRFGVKDKDFLEEINKHISAIIIKKEPYRISRNKRHYYELNVCSKHLCNYLRSWSNIVLIANSFPSDFLRGLFDAEGSVSSILRDKTPRIDISNTNEKIIKLACELLCKMHINFKMYRHQNKPRDGYIRKDDYRITIMRHFDSYVFYSNIGFSIKRKMAKLRKYHNTEKSLLYKHIRF